MTAKPLKRYTDREKNIALNLENKDKTFEIRGGKIVEVTTHLQGKKKRFRIKTKRQRHRRKLRRRNKTVNTLTYGEYMNSKKWRTRRNLYWRNHKRVCVACASTSFMEVHHMVYEKKQFGNEPDYHLIGLCQSCHQEFHDKNGSAHNMVQATREFIKWKKNPEPDLTWI